MIKQPIDKLIEACKGKILQKGLQEIVEGISTDSRTIKTNHLFIPLVGENFDGHDFITSAKEKGASAILCEKNKKISLAGLENIYIIEVQNTLIALQDISTYYRELFSIPFIAITGSTGKTSTKDMVSSVLSYKYDVLKNIGNLNNHIGLPLTIFNLDKHHEVGVLEMGMSGAGEILTLTEIVKPNIAVITNIGVSHIENLGSRENIMKAKMEVASFLGEDDYLLLNGDNDLLSTLKNEPSTYNRIFFGFTEDNDIYPKNLEDLGENGFAFVIPINGVDHSFRIKQPGIHNVYNALAAIWIGLHNGMEIEAIRAGLENHKPSKMRMEIHTINGMKVINDAYNASPDSMKAALMVLKDMEGKRKVAVLGNMFELGNFSEEGHRMVGAYAADKIDLLITVGDMAQWIADEVKEQGVDFPIYKTMSNEEAIEVLEDVINEKDIILIKGSRGMTMEKIVHYLQERS